MSTITGPPLWPYIRQVELGCYYHSHSIPDRPCRLLHCKEAIKNYYFVMPLYHANVPQYDVVLNNNNNI